MTTLSPRAGALTVSAVALLAGCSFLMSADKHDEISYRVSEKITALTVHNPAGETEVTAGTGPVSVREEYTYSSAKPTTSHKVEGTTLDLVNSGCGPEPAARCEVDYRIVVPAGTAVTVDAKAGLVTVSGISAAVKIDTDAGGARLTDVTGAVTVTADAGSVTGAGLTGPTTVEAHAAAVDLSYATPPTSVLATTDAGNIVVRLPAGTYAVAATVFAGRRVVDVPTDPSSPNMITVRSMAGSVEVVPA